MWFHSHHRQTTLVHIRAIRCIGRKSIKKFLCISDIPMMVSQPCSIIDRGRGGVQQHRKWRKELDRSAGWWFKIRIWSIRRVAEQPRKVLEAMEWQWEHLMGIPTDTPRQDAQLNWLLVFGLSLNSKLLLAVRWIRICCIAISYFQNVKVNCCHSLLSF